mmetsp:Transcript_6267/g.11882  ORF Transcript_6267/g.11882 Transcript_6267/m.11882 type:complete len:997 (+) Transcript_6267:1247-4237(+)
MVRIRVAPDLANHSGHITLMSPTNQTLGNLFTEAQTKLQRKGLPVEALDCRLVVDPEWDDHAAKTSADMTNSSTIETLCKRRKVISLLLVKNDADQIKRATRIAVAHVYGNQALCAAPGCKRFKNERLNGYCLQHKNFSSANKKDGDKELGMFAKFSGFFIGAKGVGQDTQAPSVTCPGCEQVVEAGDSQVFLETFDVTYHTECLTCFECARIMDSETARIRGAELFCKKHAAERCPACGEMFGINDDEDDKVEALEALWHSKCFTCAKCLQPLSGLEDEFFEKDHNLYCAEDYDKLFVTKCDRCGLPGTDGEEWVHVKVSGQKFHASCAKCAACSISLKNKTIYADDNSDDIFCFEHYEKIAIRCEVCNDYIVSNMLHKAGKHYHAKCFYSNAAMQTLSNIKETKEKQKSLLAMTEKKAEEKKEGPASGGRRGLRSIFVKNTDSSTEGPPGRSDRGVSIMKGWGALGRGRDQSLAVQGGAHKEEDKNMGSKIKELMDAELERMKAKNLKKKQGKEVEKTGKEEGGSGKVKYKDMVDKSDLIPFITEGISNAIAVDSYAKLNEDYRKKEFFQLEGLMTTAITVSDLPAADTAGTTTSTTDDLDKPPPPSSSSSSTATEEEEDKVGELPSTTADTTHNRTTSTTITLKPASHRDSSASNDPLLDDSKPEEGIAVAVEAADSSTTTTTTSTFEYLFQDYAPQVFFAIRKMYGIDQFSYRKSLVEEGLKGGQLGAGKSGMLFYFSSDNRYVLKTITRGELKFFRQILRPYFKYLKKNPHTLLPRFFGIYKITMPDSKPLRLIVMNNLFDTPIQITQKFDLKGSTRNRYVAIEEEGEKAKGVLKDLNFTDSIRVGPGKAALFSQLSKDAKWLMSMDIMDHSLLLGVHPGNVKTTADMNKSVPISLDDLKQPLASCPNNDKYSVVSCFQKEYNGIRSFDPDGKPRKEVYLLGIIDILQKFGMKKRFESTYKGMKFNKLAISAVNAQLYGERFLAFLDEKIT